MLPIEITGVVTGLVSALLVIAVVLLIAYFLSRRRKVPPSPDYKAIGDFRPSSVFSWDSSASITKSLQEEHQTVHPLYGGLKDCSTTNIHSATATPATPVTPTPSSVSDDDASLSGSTATGSSHSSLAIGVIDKRHPAEHHTVQPRYGGLKGCSTTNIHTASNIAPAPATPVTPTPSSVSDDDASLSGSTATGSSHSSLAIGVMDKRHSFRDNASISSKLSSRNRTLSEMSETSSTSVDSATFDAASIIGIKPELYTKKDSVLRQESSIATLGRLHIRIKYDFRTSDLIVHLIEAQDISGFEHTTGFNDPFVKLKLEPLVDNKTRQSSIKRQTKNPVFDEYFKWPVGFDDLRDKRLEFQLFDFDKFSHNEQVGEVQIDFSQTDVSTTVELWCDIEPASQNEDGLGELLVSLSYLPTAERLTTVVMKARSLKQPRASNKIDPVVRTTLIVDGKTKRKRTSVRKGTANPVWNEAHVFSLPQNLLDHATIEFAVADHELLGHGDIIGQCTLGKNRLGKEGIHWTDMTHNVRKAVAKWQVLQSQ